MHFATIDIHIYLLGSLTLIGCGYMQQHTCENPITNLSANQIWYNLYRFAQVIIYRVAMNNNFIPENPCVRQTKCISNFIKVNNQKTVGDQMSKWLISYPT